MNDNEWENSPSYQCSWWEKLIGREMEMGAEDGLALYHFKPNKQKDETKA